MTPEQKAAVRRLAEESSDRFVAGVRGVQTEAILRDEINILRARVAALEKALEASAAEHIKSADQFSFYVEQHKAKTPPDHDKAQTNVEHMGRCINASLAARAAREG